MIEGKTGGPEKPLSDLGHRTYVSYWTHKILNILIENKLTQLSIMDISNLTSITPGDISQLLEDFDILKSNNGRYYFNTDPEYLKKVLAGSGHPGRPVQRDKIHWVP